MTGAEWSRIDGDAILKERFHLPFLYHPVSNHHTFHPATVSPNHHTVTIHTGYPFIPQEHKRTCLVACAAMLTKATYAATLAHFEDAIHSREPLWKDTLAFLVEQHRFGLISHHFYADSDRVLAHGPVALIDVSIPRLEIHHGAIMFANGTVFDPILSEPVHVTEYRTVWKVFELLPPRW